MHPCRPNHSFACYRPMVLMIQSIELHRPERRSVGTKPMLWMAETYRLEGVEEGSGKQKVSNGLTYNLLETLPKYGLICEKIFFSSEFLILRGLF